MTKLTLMTGISDKSGNNDIAVSNILPGIECYYNNLKATNETIDKDGWLHTGDVAHYNEAGNLYIVDRLKELIKYKGYEVSPVEIEVLLLSHPAVKDAVASKFDELAGELLIAFIAKQPNSEVIRQEIIDFVKILGQQNSGIGS
ncbi:hypothetical protein M0802_013273 [Mischocyttarus mexicanus]|nr:hypothetical protein M0802_013273 [Mischocyttarus mexicanus]